MPHRKRVLGAVAGTFAAAVGLMLVLYAVLGIWPFGELSVITGDLNSQYIPYFSHYKRFFAGEAGFGYGFDKALGGSLVGLFAYYVASPFNLVYLLVPVESFAAVAGLVLLLKIALAAAFMRLFLEVRTPGLGLAGLALSLGYGFCTYALAYAQNIMWHDGVLLLPLVLLGLDRLRQGRSPALYITTLALAIVANFYVGYMICLFVVLWLVCSLVAQPSCWRRTAVRFAGSSVLAGGIGAAVWVPMLLDVSNSKGSLLEFTFSTEMNFALGELPRMLVLGDFRHADVIAGLPFLYCGLLALVAGLAFFFEPKIPLLERLAGAGVVLVMLISFRVEGLDVIWHGLKAAVWFPYRNAFLFCAALVVLAGRAISVKPGLRAWGISAALVVAGGLWLMVAYGAAVSRKRTLITVVVALVLLCLCAAGPLLKRFKRQGLFEKAAPVLLALVVAGELCFTSVAVMDSFEKYTVAVFSDFVADGTATVEALAAHNDAQGLDGAYRMEKGWYRSLNDGMLLGYNGVSHFGSTTENNDLHVMKQLGYGAELTGFSTYVYGRGATAFSDAVLGVRWYFSDGSRAVPSHYEALELGAPYEAYGNPYALPLFNPLYGHDLNEEGEQQSTFAYQNLLYAALSGDGEALFSPAVLAGHSGTGEVYADTVLEVQAEAAGYYYALARSGGDFLHDVPLLINGEEAGRVFSANDTGVIDLGWLEPGQSVAVAFVLEEEGREPLESIYLDSFEAVCMDAQKLAALAAKPPVAEVHTFEDGRVEAAVTLEESGWVLVSIVYDENWRCSVDGAGGQLEKAFGGLTALWMEAGTHEVSLRYRVAGSGVGWAVTGVSLAVAVALGVYGVYNRKRKK